MVTVGGRIVKTFGTGGELYITLYDTFTDTDIKEPVFIEMDGIRTPFFFKSFARRGQNKAVVVFDDMENEHRAAELVGREFSVLEPAEDEEDERYIEDVVGFTAYFEGFEPAGKITGYIDNEFNPLFEAEYLGREVLIPVVDEYIVSINERKKSITLRVPEELLNLNCQMPSLL